MTEAVETIQGTAVPTEAFIDGWQAYCAGMGEDMNPYFYDRDSEDYRVWRRAYHNAKRADEHGCLGETGPAVREYFNRHPEPHD